jgi:two-component system, chemotaxis family, protein-glutamate methylesterase/glutaminase
MPTQDIVVIGTSAGGVDALRQLVAGLPADLPAAVFVVQHIGRGSDGQSYLPNILARAGQLPAVHPHDGEAVKRGRIYVAPPDHHLLLEPGRMRLSGGPKENRTRPAINPLFRSAANAYDGRVTGVVLTGTLDDGVAGLAEIKRQGGVAIVEDPATALFPAMPQSALQRVEVDYVTPVHGIGPLLSRLAITERKGKKKKEDMKRTPTALTCPECRGPITEERQGKIVEYACRVGHRYSPLAMEDEHHETVERSLWASIVALEEAADIAEKLAPELGARTRRDVRRKREQARLLKGMLNNPHT